MLLANTTSTNLSASTWSGAAAVIKLIQLFLPVSTKSSLLPPWLMCCASSPVPMQRASVSNMVTSTPVLGSVKQKAALSSPLASRFKYLSFCAREPYLVMTRAAISLLYTSCMPRDVEPALAHSSSTRATLIASKSRPPYSPGIDKAKSWCSR